MCGGLQKKNRDWLCNQLRLQLWRDLNSVSIIIPDWWKNQWGYQPCYNYVPPKIFFKNHFWQRVTHIFSSLQIGTNIQFIYLLRIYQRSTSRFQVEREAFAFEDNAFIWNISGAFAFVNDWRWRILQHENSHNRIQLFFWCSKNSWYTQYFFCALCFAPHIFMINFHIVIYLETENKKFSCFAAFFFCTLSQKRVQK